MINTSTDTVTLPRELANELLQQAQLGDSHEICGLIGARRKPDHPDLACRCYPIPNIADNSHCRYIMEPASQIKAMREMREHDEELFAIYHSHPSSPAEPSSIDINEASYPEALYLIISLNTKGVLEIRGFHLHDGQSREVDLVID
jgi:proteasome lid subunit RPN8/RPN11